MTLDGPFIIIRGEQVMGSHDDLQDALDDARYLATIEPRLPFTIIEAKELIPVHTPC